MAISIERDCPTHWDEGLRRSLAAVRTITALAKGLGVSRGILYRWQRIPGDLVVKAEEVTGVPRETLRPDLYRPQPQSAQG